MKKHLFLLVCLMMVLAASSAMAWVRDDYREMDDSEGIDYKSGSVIFNGYTRAYCSVWVLNNTEDPITSTVWGDDGSVSITRGNTNNNWQFNYGWVTAWDFEIHYEFDATGIGYGGWNCGTGIHWDS